MTRRNSIVRNEGATTVEVALILPLFLLLVFSIIAFSRYVQRRALVDHALRQAGRYGATLQGDCLTPAKDRFYAAMGGTGFESGVTLHGDVVRLVDNSQAIRLIVDAS